MRFNWFAITLVIICVAVFVLQISNEAITDQYLLESSDVFSRPWILVTSIFLHGSIEHLFYNMFALALFGSILERIIGGKKFLVLYFLAGIIAGLGTIPFYEASLGASGAIMGILGTLAVLRPGMRVYISYVPMPMAAAVVVWAAGDLIGFFAPSNVANAAHLFGLGFGLIIGFYLKKKYGERIISKRKSRININEEEFEEWEDDWM
ncbi:MAG: rhomboid family intramembrane serine protease [Candidatus Aenigmatarchaeota archaeon]